MAGRERKTVVAPTVVRAFENPFGEVSEEQTQGAPLADNFFVKGYSDKRHERELAIKEGRKPEPMPHRLQFVGVEDRAGRPVGDKQLAFRQLGYKPLLWDEAKSMGFDLENSTAVRNADGTVRVGSQMLMITDASTAARHYQKQRDATDMLNTLANDNLKDAVGRYNASRGLTEVTGSKAEFEEKVVVRKHQNDFEIE